MQNNKSKEFPGNSPAEAWEIYRTTNGEKILPLTVFEYVVKNLTTLPLTEEAMMAMSRDDFYALAELTSALSRMGLGEFDIRSWEHLSKLSSDASTRVAEINSIHGNLSRITGIARTAAANARKY